MLPIDRYPGGTTSPAHFISGANLHDIAISGAGAIDGQGQAWWDAFSANKSVARPKMIYFSACTRMLIQSVTLSNSPMFHIATDNAWNATVNGVSVSAPPSSGVPNPSHNTYACDIGGTNVLVANSYFSVGDDNR